MLDNAPYPAPAQAAPDRKTPVFGQALANDAPVLSASVTAACDPAPTRDDAALIALWLDGRPPATQRAYKTDAAALLACHGGVPLRQATLVDLQRRSRSGPARTLGCTAFPHLIADRSHRAPATHRLSTTMTHTMARARHGTCKAVFSAYLNFDFDRLGFHSFWTFL